MFLQDLQATFRVISCNPSTTWMNCCQAASLITMLRPLLSYNAGARGFCLSSFFDKSYWPLRRFWPCGDGDAYCQTFLPQIACTNERNQMPGAEFLISWVGVGGGGCYPFLHGILGCQVKGTRQVQAPVGPGKRRPGKVEPIFFTVQMAMATCWNMLKKYVKLLPPGKQRWQWKAHHV